MEKILVYIGIGLCVVGGLAIYSVIVHSRHQRDHSKDLEPVLAAHGLIFMSARWPGMFNVGPFPKVEIQVGGSQSRVGGIRGEYDEYRIVTAQDSQDNIHVLWARLEFEFFRLRSIRWRAENVQNLPPSAREMFEN